ncbi:sulfate/molybdate ABC transporter ATP-binding protein [Proteocatella sphenisci]|uniref:sulfate/molybdate ABC transporter ATP-binding protein n=1 Tax=Proteocatella sphenisci TaxID=181070 RepID=UPI0004B268C0|nr:ATP-binding cassette domain-containing protein [Proteocatella sphenisci]
MNLRANFTKKSGSFTLKVNIDTGSGKLGLFGASGSGKSMTLKCIAGIETPDEGIISLGERVLFDSANKINLRPQQRKIGYLFQSYALFPNMTVRENIIAGIRDKKKRDIIFEKSIESFSLQGMEKKYPYQLSGGQQQRVALARVIASQPDLLLLDEPMSALDEELRINTEKEIEKVMDESKGTIFVSHSRKEVFRLCDEIAFVKSGKIDGTKSLDDLALDALSNGNIRVSDSTALTRGKITIEIDPVDDITKAIRDIIKG